MGEMVLLMAALVGGLMFALTSGWLMTLVLLAVLPLVLFTKSLYSWTLRSVEEGSKARYEKAGGRAEEALSSIRAVKQLNGEAYESKEFEKLLKEITSSQVPGTVKAGAATGLLFFVMLSSYALGLWYGSRCVAGGDSCPASIAGSYTPGDVIVVLFSVLMLG